MKRIGIALGEKAAEELNERGERRVACVVRWGDGARTQDQVAVVRRIEKLQSMWQE